MNEWQPIDTAPIEQGFECLVTADNKIWLAFCEVFEDTPYDGQISCGWYAYPNIDIGRVTHWMPLPELPE